MRSSRQHKVDVAIARALSLVGPYMVPDSVLKADASRLVVPRATESELEESVRYHDGQKRLTSVTGESETQWKLNDLGRAWLQENA